MAYMPGSTLGIPRNISYMSPNKPSGIPSNNSYMSPNKPSKLGLPLGLLGDKPSLNTQDSRGNREDLGQEYYQPDTRIGSRQQMSSNFSINHPGQLSPESPYSRQPNARANLPAALGKAPSSEQGTGHSDPRSQSSQNADMRNRFQPGRNFF